MARLCKGDVQFPKSRHISPDCRDFLSRLICVDPAKRVSAADCQKHPWFTKVSTHPWACHQSCPVPIDSAFKRLTISYCHHDVLPRLIQRHCLPGLCSSFVPFPVVCSSKACSNNLLKQWWLQRLPVNAAVMNTECIKASHGRLSPESMDRIRNLVRLARGEAADKATSLQILDFGHIYVNGAAAAPPKVVT